MNARELLHRYVPSHFNDPLGLAVRILKSRDLAALFALGSAGAGVVAAPLDVLLQSAERQTYATADEAQHPLILICGPPRSGTTVVYQTLVSHLPVAYFSNLTSLFPRSPLSALRLFERFLDRSPPDYRNFYGKTRGLAGTNDALYLWDRWLGPVRDDPPLHLTAAQQTAMRQFFAASDQHFGRPIVNKNNNLVASAHLVAECLPHAHFICLTRDLSALARSLYRARCEIHGTPTAAYGPADRVNEPKQSTPTSVRSVCAQAVYLDRLSRRQYAEIGGSRFWLLAYEQFCAAPGEFVRRVAAEVLGDEKLVRGTPPRAFPISSAQRVSSEIATQIEAELPALSASA